MTTLTSDINLKEIAFFNQIYAPKLSQSVHFLVDEQGQRQSVVLDYALWQQLLAFLKQLMPNSVTIQAIEEAQARQALEKFDSPAALFADLGI